MTLLFWRRTGSKHGFGRIKIVLPRVNRVQVLSESPAQMADIQSDG